MSEEWKKIIISNDWDSKHLIGEVRERYEQIKHQGISHSLRGEDWDWQSFYTGWIEGRMSMLVELTKEEWREGYGRVQDKQRSDQTDINIGE